MSFAYDAQEHGFLVVSLTFFHTVWPRVLGLPGFWIFIILHVLLWASFRSNLIEEHFPEYTHLWKPGGFLFLDGSHMKVISAMTVFFEVFYTSQCYTRYFNLCGLCNQVFRCAHRACYDLKVHITPESLQDVRLVMRWMRVSMLLFFIELRHGETSPIHWYQLLQFGLVRQEEADFLGKLTPMQRYLVMLHWMARVTVIAYEKKPAGPPILVNLVGRLTLLDESMKHVLNVVSMPVPFQYFHLLNAMVSICVGLWAYSMSFDPSVFSPVVFSCASFIFIGMLELAKEFSDPFGSDEVDFPLHIWFEKFLETNLALLEYDFPGAANDFQVSRAEEKEPGWEPSSVAALIGDEDIVVVNNSPPSARQPLRSSPGQSARYLPLQLRQRPAEHV